MMYINPFEVTCEHCNHNDKYDVKKLLKFESKCTNCGKILRESPFSMHRHMRLNAIESWPCAFLFDCMEKLSIDYDLVSDETLEEIKTVRDFVNLAKHYINDEKYIVRKIKESSLLKEIENYEKDILLEYKLKDLAVMSYPEISES